MTRLVAALLALGFLTAGCTGDDHASARPPSSPPGTSASASSGGTGSTTTAATRALDRKFNAVEALLRRRSQAILAKDRAAFVATTVPGTGRAKQLGWYAPLTSLPLAKVSYDVRLVDPHGTDRHTRVEADMLVQIAGFDPAPLPVSHVLDVRRVPDGYRVVQDLASRDQVSYAPWLLPGVKFTITDQALIAYDRGSADQAGRVERLADEAITHVDDAIPYDWSRKVVFLMPSTTAPLRYEGFDPVEIHNLGGVAYPIRGPDEHETGSRVMIAPVMLKQDDRSLSTVLRHEVAHVAIGTHDDLDPVWVVEGIAEYVAQLGDSTKYIASSAVKAADQGIDQMPPDGTFHFGDWGVNYGIAAWSMEWLAMRHGTQAPFRLVDALHAREPIDFHEESHLLDRRYQVTTDELAHRAGDLIQQTFG
jgi:hypothetical protein